MSSKLQSTPLQKTKGAVRNLTDRFRKLKDAPEAAESLFESDIGSRFKPLKTNFLIPSQLQGLTPGAGGYSGVNSPQETEKLTSGGETFKLLPNGAASSSAKPLSTKASSNDDSGGSIEYGKRFLPPLWVDIQEEIEHQFDEITTKSNEQLLTEYSE